MKAASIFLIATLLVVFVSAGCSTGRTAASVANAGKVFMMWQDLGPTLTQSTGDHMHSINAVIDQDLRAFYHDLDLLYQTDRPTRLTPWHDR
jgi:hypothetical protein